MRFMVKYSYIFFDYGVLEFYVKRRRFMIDKKNLLIIDDSEIDRSILKNILIDDFTVFEASNGYDGLKQLIEKRNRIDGVLLDLHMPILDGFHVLELMKEHKIYNIPIVIVTSESTEENLVKTLPYLISDFICKPYDKEFIQKRMRTLFHIKWV